MKYKYAYKTYPIKFNKQSNKYPQKGYLETNERIND